MKQGKRKLQLDRTTIRPLDPQQLTRIGGGTGEGYNDSDLVCNGSMTANYSQNQQCASVADPASN